MKTVAKSVTDERLVIDALVPGFGASDITVRACKVNGGETAKIVVKGTRSARKNKDGDAVPELALDKELPSTMKLVFSDDAEFGEPLFKSGTFNSKDYELDKLVWSVANGVLRISIPKTEKAVGAAVAPVENADASSTGVAED